MAGAGAARDGRRPSGAPGLDAALEVAGVDAGRAQRGSRVAADLVAVHAVEHDRPVAGQVLLPVGDGEGIAPGGAGDHRVVGFEARHGGARRGRGARRRSPGWRRSSEGEYGRDTVSMVVLSGSRNAELGRDTVFAREGRREPATSRKPNVIAPVPMAASRLSSFDEQVLEQRPARRHGVAVEVRHARGAQHLLVDEEVARWFRGWGS